MGLCEHIARVLPEALQVRAPEAVLSLASCTSVQDSAPLYSIRAVDYVKVTLGFTVRQTVFNLASTRYFL